MAKIIELKQVNCSDCLSYVDIETARMSMRLYPCIQGKPLGLSNTCMLYKDYYGQTTLRILQKNWSKMKIDDIIKTTLNYCRHNSTLPEKLTIQGKIIFINKYYITVMTANKIKHTVLIADVVEGNPIHILKHRGE